MSDGAMISKPDRSVLSTVDPDILAAVDARAEDIVRGALVDSKIVAMLALGSIPIALGALAKDVYGQTPVDVLDVLQFALLLEYLEADFYQRGMNASGLIPASDLTVFSTISAHETAHIGALQGLISGKGGTSIAKPTFDYTAKGSVPGFAFSATQYDVFTSLAQAFEDTGVRAYKGQVGRLINDKPVLAAAMAIHSVEARHASEVRRLRGLKGWVAGTSRDDLPAFLQAAYVGEENVTQLSVNVSTLATGSVSANSATEAFDEPLTMAQVMAIVTPFLP
ncbi:MAG: ferritin-like domain-containing protein [bacterium]